MSFDEIRQQLLELDTASICDANKALGGQLRVMASAIRPLAHGLTMVWLAHTVSCQDDFLAVIKGLRDGSPGEVLVIDSQQSTRAVTGNLFPTEAMRRGMAGIVNDGPCRDTAVVRSMGFPYYARSVTCAPGQSSSLGETQVPISCGGVTVNPGDILFGDDDGVVVASAEEVTRLIPIAQQVQEKEARLLEGMAQGVSLLEMLNFDEHCENLAAGKPSKLEFRV
ncbi:MAG: RraA family protein [Pirellulaceae bacterium]|jgi:regulator of RNase E activity RraA|nr:RraA family protein [Pirellulaceae bacterium]MDP7016181.1 RraA family protein [Pirellulaceae bacterium]